MNAAIKEFMDKAGKPMDWSNGAPVTPSEKGAESPSTGSPAPSGSSGVQEATQTPTVDAPVAGTNTDTVDAVASSSNVDDYDSPVANAPPPQPSDYATSNPGDGGERLDPRLSDEYVEYGGDPNSLATGDTCSGACTAQ